MTLDNLAPDTQYTVEVVALFSKRFREPLRSAPGVATGTTSGEHIFKFWFYFIT